MIRWMICVVGALGLIGVMVGAYAAHGLEVSLRDQGLAPEDVAKRLEQCDVAVRYHMLHVLALMGLALTPFGCPKRRSVAAGFLLAGIALFSGGLYSMVFLGVMGHWAIVPSGGLCFMIGWGLVAFVGLQDSSLSAKTRADNDGT